MCLCSSALLFLELFDGARGLGQPIVLVSLQQLCLVLITALRRVADRSHVSSELSGKGIPVTCVFLVALVLTIRLLLISSFGGCVSSIRLLLINDLALNLILLFILV